MNVFRGEREDGERGEGRMGKGWMGKKEALELKKMKMGDRGRYDVFLEKFKKIGKKYDDGGMYCKE